MAYKDLITDMNKYLLMTMLLIPLGVQAQITVRDHTAKPTSAPYVVKYDSLTNIEKLQDDSIIYHTSYNHLIGQMLFYVDEDTVDIKNGASFYTYVGDSYDNVAHLRRGGRIDKKKYRNRYWRVNEVKVTQYGYDIFELEDTTNHEKIYARGMAMNRDFIVLGYYEKMKQMYVGKTFIYDNYFPYGKADGVENNYKYNNLINYETNVVGDSIPKESIWRCVDISAYNITHHDYWKSASDRRSPVILIFENDKLGKYYSYTQKRSGNAFDDKKYCFWLTTKGHEEERLPLYLGKFLDENQQAYISNRETENDQSFAAQKKRMIAKYGKYWGGLIADGKLEIGMTKQMCRDSWGEPEDINTTSTRYGTHEQWVYTTIYVYFDNGRISAIQDR